MASNALISSFDFTGRRTGVDVDRELLELTVAGVLFEQAFQHGAVGGEFRVIAGVLEAAGGDDAGPALGVVREGGFGGRRDAVLGEELHEFLGVFRPREAQQHEVLTADDALDVRRDGNRLPERFDAQRVRVTGRQAGAVFAARRVDRHRRNGVGVAGARRRGDVQDVRLLRLLGGDDLLAGLAARRADDVRHDERHHHRERGNDGGRVRELQVELLGGIGFVVVEFRRVRLAVVRAGEHRFGGGGFLGGDFFPNLPGGDLGGGHRRGCRRHEFRRGGLGDDERRRRHVLLEHLFALDHFPGGFDRDFTE
ncbi:MAG: hypothetical protein QM754_13555 [Tepidisphaeraceae bacterium]